MLTLAIIHSHSSCPSETMDGSFTPAKICDYLASKGIPLPENFDKKLEDELIDGASFQLLTDDDMQDLGLKMGPRIRIRKLIGDVRAMKLDILTMNDLSIRKDISARKTRASTPSNGWAIAANNSGASRPTLPQRQSDGCCLFPMDYTYPEARLSICTLEHLNNKKTPTITMENEIIRQLHTDISLYTKDPTHHIYHSAARSVVKRWGHLAGNSSVLSVPYEHWRKKLSQKFRNERRFHPVRPRKRSIVEAEEGNASKAQLEDTSVGSETETSCESVASTPEDGRKKQKTTPEPVSCKERVNLETEQRTAERITPEIVVKKEKANLQANGRRSKAKKSEDMMADSFLDRKKYVNEGCSIAKICDMYPMLQDEEQLYAELGRWIKLSNCKEVFLKKFAKVSEKLIIMAKFSQSWQIRKIMDSYDQALSGEVHANLKMYMRMIAATFLLHEVLFCKQKMLQMVEAPEDLAMAARRTKNPVIIYVNSPYSKEFEGAVAAEGQIIAKTRSCATSFLLLIAMYRSFGLTWPSKCHCALFLQKGVLGMEAERMSAKHKTVYQQLFV